MTCQFVYKEIWVLTVPVRCKILWFPIMQSDVSMYTYSEIVKELNLYLQ